MPMPNLTDMPSAPCDVEATSDRRPTTVPQGSDRIYHLFGH